MFDQFDRFQSRHALLPVSSCFRRVGCVYELGFTTQPSQHGNTRSTQRTAWCLSGVHAGRKTPQSHGHGGAVALSVVSYTVSWDAHGTLMGRSWDAHEPWASDGRPIRHPWDTHGTLMSHGHETPWGGWYSSWSRDLRPTYGVPLNNSIYLWYQFHDVLKPKITLFWIRALVIWHCRENLKPPQYSSDVYDRWKWSRKMYRTWQDIFKLCASFDIDCQSRIPARKNVPTL